MNGGLLLMYTFNRPSYVKLLFDLLVTSTSALLSAEIISLISS
jgi:hypothetical protein